MRPSDAVHANDIDTKSAGNTPRLDRTPETNAVGLTLAKSAFPRSFLDERGQVAEGWTVGRIGIVQPALKELVDGACPDLRRYGADRGIELLA
jgi:hypothetical protein